MSTSDWITDIFLVHRVKYRSNNLNASDCDKMVRIGGMTITSMRHEKRDGLTSHLVEIISIREIRQESALLMHSIG